MGIYVRYYFLCYICYFCIKQVFEIDGILEKGEVLVFLDGDIDFVGVEFSYLICEEVKVKVICLCVQNIIVIFS